MKKLLTPVSSHQELSHALKGVPVSVWDLLAPIDNDEIDNYVKNAKALRIREKERNYVLDIQNNYNLPLRPNESLKRTMIRVRLQVLRKRLQNRKHRNGTIKDSFNLPIDPLE